MKWLRWRDAREERLLTKHSFSTQMHHPSSTVARHRRSSLSRQETTIPAWTMPLSSYVSPLHLLLSFRSFLSLPFLPPFLSIFSLPFWFLHIRHHHHSTSRITLLHASPHSPLAPTRIFPGQKSRKNRHANANPQQCSSLPQSLTLFPASAASSGTEATGTESCTCSVHSIRARTPGRDLGVEFALCNCDACHELAVDGLRAVCRDLVVGCVEFEDATAGTAVVAEEGAEEEDGRGGFASAVSVRWGGGVNAYVSLSLQGGFERPRGGVSCEERR